MCVCVGGGGGRGLKDEMGEIEGEVGGGNLKVRYGVGWGELKTRCGEWKGKGREGKWTPPLPSLTFRQLSSRSTPLAHTYDVQM